MAVLGKGFSMDARRLVIVFTVVIAALVAIPTTAMAGSVEMRGVVSGSPYGASGHQMAIPVLFSKMTARNAGLKSPVGVIIVKRTDKVKLPNGAGFTIPVNLRTGDRFKGFGDIGSLQKKVFYPRVVFQQPVVYFRSKELSLSELSVAVDSLRKSLDGLSTQFAGMRAFALQQLGLLATQLTDLQRQLAALAATQADFAKQLAALGSRVGDLEAGLAKQVNDLKAAINRIGAIEGTIGTVDVKKLRSDLDGLITGLNAYALKADIPAMPDLSGFALKTDIPTLPDLSGFALKTDIPTIPDLSGYLTSADLPDLSGYLTSADLPDLSGYLTAADLPDLSGYLTAADLP